MGVATFSLTLSSIFTRDRVGNLARDLHEDYFIVGIPFFSLGQMRKIITRKKGLNLETETYLIRTCPYRLAVVFYIILLMYCTVPLLSPYVLHRSLIKPLCTAPFKLTCSCPYHILLGADGDMSEWLRVVAEAVAAVVRS